MTRLFLMVLLLSASACLKSTEPQPSLLQLNGAWNYTGVQTSPTREIMSGTLTVSRESGTSFQGRLDLVSTNAQTGQSTVLGGLVSGAESDGSVIDFDADLDAGIGVAGRLRLHDLLRLGGLAGRRDRHLRPRGGAHGNSAIAADALAQISARLCTCFSARLGPSYTCSSGGSLLQNWPRTGCATLATWRAPMPSSATRPAPRVRRMMPSKRCRG